MSKTARALPVALLGAVNALGVAAFVYPFFLGAVSRRSETLAHASDAPIVFSVFGALLIAIAVTEVRGGRMDAKQVALLGILSGINAMLRLPGALAGANLMFALPILCGYAFGARFGFLLGASSMAASAVFTGGIGPWLPFQMWALGWVGAGAALFRAAGDGRRAVLALAAYGWIAGLAFGALMNLWFWPFQSGPGPLQWSAGLGPGEAVRHYWRFYVATSLAWDSARAIVNVVVIATLGRPILRLLIAYRGRTQVAWAR